MVWYSDYIIDPEGGNSEEVVEQLLQEFPEVFASGNSNGVYRRPIAPTDAEPEAQLVLTPLAELPSVAEGLAAESEAPFLQATDAFLVNARAVRAPLLALWPL